MKTAIVGWDIGGAHVKACWLADGEVVDVGIWPCSLWQGLSQLEHALAAALRRLPAAADGVELRHAVTMTGEMVDLFAHREQGVLQIAQQLERSLGRDLNFFSAEAGWCRLIDLPRHWAEVASANWLASARHAARRVAEGLLVDIGSTTTDVIALAGGAVATPWRSDAERLASGELVYHGVVRTPLCAFARRIRFRSETVNVMNEFFATAADVYRLTGELDDDADLYPSADGAAKDAASTRQRLARMIGRDAREADADEWQRFAAAWRTEQIVVIGEQLERVAEHYELAADAPLVSAGCGDFLVAAIAEASGRRCIAYASEVAPLPSNATVALARRAQVCAPCVAVAALFDQEHRESC